MSSRREALVGRFRASSLERIRRLGSALTDVERGTATPEQLQQIARELHTLKGESTMLNFAALGELVHAVEEAFGAATEDDVRRRSVAHRVLEALAVATEWLRSADGASDALNAACERMARGPTGTSVAAAAMAPAASAPREPPDVAQERPKNGAERWVQVNARRIDEHSERALVFEAEFRTLYSKLQHYARSLGDGAARGLWPLLTDFDRCQANLEDITTSAWALRLVPVEPALGELAAYGRSLAASNGKSLRVSVSGGNPQIERTVLESLEEPLVHLVRNAIDHGIEAPPERARAKKGEAQLVFGAEAVGANVVLTVTDDGCGIDPQNVRAAAVTRGLLDEKGAALLAEDDVLELLFLHGFSTRAAVTSLSGRGVGLDVVRASVEAVGGAVAVTSEVGRGTTFRLTVPASISKEKGLVLDVAGSLYAIPSRMVRSVVRLASAEIVQVAGGSALRVGDETVPLRSIQAALGLGDGSGESWAVIVEFGRHLWAFTITKPLGDFSLLRRPIDKIVGSSAPVNASATFEDGRLVLILSMSDLVRRTRPQSAPRAEDAADEAAIRVLVVDDSAVVRELLQEVLTHAGIEVRLAPEGATALRMVADHTPDLVLLDIDMPRMDGFDVLRAIRTTSDVPVVMLSLRASAEDQRRAASLGANAYIVKSQFQETTLVDTMRRLLGRSS